MTTTATGLLCWRDFHPLEWQLASLHQIRTRPGVEDTQLREPVVGEARDAFPGQADDAPVADAVLHEAVREQRFTAALLAKNAFEVPELARSLITLYVGP